MLSRHEILIVEDEALFSELLGQTLCAEPGLDVVGEAKDGEAALQTETVRLRAV